ncbi:hypothetical protein FJTKL_11121 [Diaporthe vaccinii]|uniref:Uncharacterized protein n=1 Tax=Diaporthe vaccinii TaxID=105482 RepID=A0ABR4EHZ5_9PEZI
MLYSYMRGQPECASISLLLYATAHDTTHGTMIPRVKITNFPFAGPEAVKGVALDDLDEHGGPVHQRLREQLQQVPALVVVDQDVQPLDGLEVLLQLPAPLVRLEPHADRLVVRGGHVDELHAARPQGGHGGQDVGRLDGDVLDARARVEDDVLLDLRPLLAEGRLVDRHLDDLVGARHDNALERGELGADLAVVDGPEPVEAQAPLVELARRHHGVPVLVADAVVDAGHLDVRQGDRGGGQLCLTEPGEEDALVAVPADERVRRVADNRGLDGLGTLSHGAAVHAFHGVDLEGDVLDGIAVSLKIGSSSGRWTAERIGDVKTKRTSPLPTTWDVKYRLPVSRPR